MSAHRRDLPLTATRAARAQVYLAQLGVLSGALSSLLRARPRCDARALGVRFGALRCAPMADRCLATCVRARLRAPYVLTAQLRAHALVLPRRCSFKARFVAPLGRSAATADFSRPVFGAVAFYMAARAAGVRVPRAQLCSAAGVSAEEFGSTLAQMEELCGDLFDDGDDDDAGGQEGAKSKKRKSGGRSSADAAQAAAAGVVGAVRLPPLLGLATRASPRKLPQQQRQERQQQLGGSTPRGGASMRTPGGDVGRAKRTPASPAHTTPASARRTRAAAGAEAAGAGASAGRSPAVRAGGSAAKRARLSFESGAP